MHPCCGLREHEKIVPDLTSHALEFLLIIKSPYFVVVSIHNFKKLVNLKYCEHIAGGQTSPEEAVEWLHSSLSARNIHCKFSFFFKFSKSHHPVIHLQVGILASAAFTNNV